MEGIVFKKFVDKYPERNLTNGLEYSAVGLISESHLGKDGSGNESGKDYLVEFFDPFGAHQVEWRSKDEISVSDISESDYNSIMSLYDAA
jgi:hypothetical protein